MPIVLASVLSALVPCRSDAAPSAPELRICDPATGETAETIYRRARTRWDESTYPSDLHYVIHIAMIRNGVPSELSYEGHAQPGRNLVEVNAFSFEERAHPIAPHGINVAIAVNGTAVRELSKPLPSYDVLGIPQLTPVYAFGLGRSLAEAQPNAGEDRPDRSDLKNIASVSAINRAYAVSCIDSTLDASNARIDHVALTPLYDPNRNRVRELWIESGSYWTDRAILARNFVDGPPLQCRWSIAFAHDENGEQISEERALGTLDYGNGKELEQLTIRFEPVSEPPRTALDTFIFDRPPESESDQLREP